MADFSESIASGWWSIIDRREGLLEQGYLIISSEIGSDSEI